MDALRRGEKPRYPTTRSEEVRLSVRGRLLETALGGTDWIRR